MDKLKPCPFDVDKTHKVKILVGGIKQKYVVCSCGLSRHSIKAWNTRPQIDAEAIWKCFEPIEIEHDFPDQGCSRVIGEDKAVKAILTLLNGKESNEKTI